MKPPYKIDDILGIKEWTFLLRERHRSVKAFYAYRLIVAGVLMPFWLFSWFVLLFPANDGRELFQNNLGFVIPILIGATLLCLMSIFMANIIPPRLFERLVRSRALPAIMVALLTIGTIASYWFIAFGALVAFAFFVLQLVFFTLSTIFIRSQKMAYSALIVFVLSVPFIGLSHFTSWLVIPIYWTSAGAFLCLQKDLLETRPQVLNLIVRWGALLAVVVLFAQIVSALIFSSSLLTISDDALFAPELTIGEYLAGSIVFNFLTAALLLFIGGLSPLPYRMARLMWRLQLIIGVVAFVVGWVFALVLFALFFSFGASFGRNGNLLWQLVPALIVGTTIAVLILESPPATRFMERVRTMLRGGRTA